MAADATYIGVAQLLADGTDQTPEDPKFETTMVSRVDGALVDWGEPRETPYGNIDTVLGTCIAYLSSPPRLLCAAPHPRALHGADCP